MRMLSFTCVLLAAAAGLAPALAHDDTLAGGEWVPTGTRGPGGPMLRFDAGRVAGTGGCNRFGGHYEQEGATLIFSPLATTRIACAPEVMRREQAFFAMLKKVRRIDIRDGTLTLLDDAGVPLARFSRGAAD